MGSGQLGSVGRAGRVSVQTDFLQRDHRRGGPACVPGNIRVVNQPREVAISLFLKILKNASGRLESASLPLSLGSWSSGRCAWYDGAGGRSLAARCLCGGPLALQTDQLDGSRLGSWVEPTAPDRRGLASDGGGYDHRSASPLARQRVSGASVRTRLKTGRLCTVPTDRP